MAFDKSFYKQFKEEIEEETKKYKAKEVKKEIKFNKCSHKNVKIVRGELRCRCGAGWQGPNIAKLFNLLTKKKI